MKTKLNGKKNSMLATPLAKPPPQEQKRFMMIVQHEVIMYGENERAARSSLLRSSFATERTKFQIVFAQEITMHEKTEYIKNRKAPGA